MSVRLLVDVYYGDQDGTVHCVKAGTVLPLLRCGMTGTTAMHDGLPLLLLEGEYEFVK